MEKDTVLNQIRSLAGTKVATREEMVTALDQGLGVATTQHVPAGLRSKLTISNIISVIGGFIAVVGIIVFVVQNWSVISDPMQVLITLGVSIAAFVGATLISYSKEETILSTVLYLISALLLPVGLFVTLYNAGVETFHVEWMVLVAALCSVTFTSLFIFTRKIIAAVFMTAFLTWLYFGVFVWIADMGNLFDPQIYYSIVTAVAGLAYLAIGWGLRQRTDLLNRLSSSFLTLGTIGFLGGTLSIGDYADFIFIFFVAGIIYASTRIGSRPMLIFGFLFLMAYILKLTGQYFADSVGWPIALVFAGFALIGVGYVGVYLNKKLQVTPVK